MHSAVVFEGPRPTPQQLNFAFPLFPPLSLVKGGSPLPRSLWSGFCRTTACFPAEKYRQNYPRISRPETLPFRSRNLIPTTTPCQPYNNINALSLPRNWRQLRPKLLSFFYVPLFCAKKRGEENIHFCNARARPVANTEKIYLGIN